MILELDSSFMLSFSTSGSWEYSSIDGLSRNLSQITVAFWMQTLDTENYGTPFSYATTDFPNAFSFVDYNG